MDILVYISDLLTKKGSLVVPGLGSFSRSRTDGYYDKEQQLFYPPAILLQFKPDIEDDDSLSQYISANRAISPASARYFIEKYVSNLKEQAASEGAEFGSFGVFYLRKNQLSFVPTSSAQNNETFYGLAPVILKRNSAYRKQAFTAPPAVFEPVIEQPPLPVFAEPVIAAPQIPEPPVFKPTLPPEPKIAEPVAAAPVVIEPVKPKEEPPYRPPSAMPRPVPAAQQPIMTKAPEPVIEDEELEEEEPKRKVSAWLIVAIIIVVLGLGLIAAYQFKPALFDRVLNARRDKPKPDREIGAAPVTAPTTQALPPDTAAVNDPTKATLDMISSARPLDTILLVVERFERLSQAHPHLQFYIEKGFSPGILQNRDTRKYEIFTGMYFNTDSAKHGLEIAKQKLNNTIVTPTIHRKK